MGSIGILYFHAINLAGMSLYIDGQSPVDGAFFGARINFRPDERPSLQEGNAQIVRGNPEIRGPVGKIKESHGNVSVCEGAHDDREIVVSGKFEEIGAIAARILLNIYQSAVCEYRLCLFRHAPNIATDHERGFEQTPCGKM